MKATAMATAMVMVMAIVPLILPFFRHCCCCCCCRYSLLLLLLLLPPSSRHRAVYLVSSTGRGAGWLAGPAFSSQTASLGRGRTAQSISRMPSSPRRHGLHGDCEGRGLASHVQQSRQQDDIPKGRALPGSASAQVSWLVGDPSIHTCKVSCRYLASLAARPRLFTRATRATYGE